MRIKIYYIRDIILYNTTRNCRIIIILSRVFLCILKYNTASYHVLPYIDSYQSLTFITNYIVKLFSLHLGGRALRATFGVSAELFSDNDCVYQLSAGAARRHVQLGQCRRRCRRHQPRLADKIVQRTIYNTILQYYNNNPRFAVQFNIFII